MSIDPRPVDSESVAAVETSREKLASTERIVAASRQSLADTSRMVRIARKAITLSARIIGTDDS